MNITKILFSWGVLAIAGLVQAQQCNPNISASLADNRFETLTGGYVRDLATNLVWTRCFVGQTFDENNCTGNPTQLSLQEGLSQADSFLGLQETDWRLPNIKEAVSIMEFSCYYPAMNLTHFPTFDTTANPLIRDLLTSTPAYKTDTAAYIMTVKLGQGSTRFNPAGNSIFYALFVRDYSE